MPSSPVAQSYRTYLTMADDDDGGEAKKPVAAPERIRFDVPDEEAGLAAHADGPGAARPSTIRLPPMVRSATVISEDSMSIRPAGSRRGSMSIEPAAGLPIQYRTL